MTGRFAVVVAAIVAGTVVDGVGAVRDFDGPFTTDTVGVVVNGVPDDTVGVFDANGAFVGVPCNTAGITDGFVGAVDICVNGVVAGTVVIAD